MFHFFYVIYTFLFGYNTCITNMVYALDPSSVIKRLWYIYPKYRIQPNYLPALVAQLDAPSDWRSGDHGFNLRRGRQHSFLEIDREIFSMVILSLQLIQEGQLSVSGKRMCTILVNLLED